MPLRGVGAVGGVRSNWGYIGLYWGVGVVSEVEGNWGYIGLSWGRGGCR